MSFLSKVQKQYSGRDQVKGEHAKLPDSSSSIEKSKMMPLLDHLLDADDYEDSWHEYSDKHIWMISLDDSKDDLILKAMNIAVDQDHIVYQKDLKNNVIYVFCGDDQEIYDLAKKWVLKNHNVNLDDLIKNKQTLKEVLKGRNA